MQYPISTLSFDEWIADQIHAIAPYAKTVKPIDCYFASGYDDVNVDFNRKIGGYGNHHFTISSLAEYYGAKECIFMTDFSIELYFDSWDDVIFVEERIKPKKR